MKLVLIPRIFIFLVGWTSNPSTMGFAGIHVGLIKFLRKIKTSYEFRYATSVITYKFISLYCHIALLCTGTLYKGVNNLLLPQDLNIWS